MRAPPTQYAKSGDASVAYQVVGDGPVDLVLVLGFATHLELQVRDERPYEVTPRDGPPTWIYDFGVGYTADGEVDVDDLRERFQEAFVRVWHGQLENDRFNGLVLAAGLDWRDVTVLRAVARYLRQAPVAFSQRYMADALIAHPAVAGALVELFHARFDPARDRSPEAADAIAAGIEEAIDAVESLDEDRILRGFLAVVRAILRTNHFQDDAGGTPNRNAVETHLRPRWGRLRLDEITGDDVARLVRDLRSAGRAEWTISGVVKAASQVFRHAHARLGWHGQNPTALLSNGERPKTGSAARRRIYRDDELAQTLAAAHEPFRTLFSLAAVTGARLSELLGLTWADVDLADLDAAEVRISFQVDRQGKRQALKTDESQRTVEIPPQLAAMLARHKLTSSRVGSAAFVFATRSGRALGQRNVVRALRQAPTRATDAKGRPTFPVLHELDATGGPVTVPQGALPSFHGFRHTAASEAIAAGDSAEEVSWQLGHKNSVVTRTIYVQEIRTAERKAQRRAKMTARYGSALEALDRSEAQQPTGTEGGNVRQLRD